MKKTFFFGAALGCLFLGAADFTVDRYGQVTMEQWPGKIQHDDQLKREAAAEWPSLRNVRFDPAKFDRYGGNLAAGQFQATGRFRLQKIDGRWWLITPEGHRYFLIGCDAVGYRESGYATPVFEADGSTRKVFSEPLKMSEFPDAFLYGGKKVNFLAANLQRKYGRECHAKSADVNRRRLIAWGFNSTSKWGWGETFGLPYVEDCDFRGAKRLANRRLDFYDKDFPRLAEETVKKLVARRKNDPMMIAYATENENGFEANDVQLLTAAKPCAAKEALVDFLIRRHGEARAAGMFGLPNQGRSAMMQNEKRVALPGEEVNAFIRESSAYYHQLVGALFKKYDPDHLWFGASHCNGQSPEWIYAAAPCVDALMFDEYAITAYWSKGLMPTLTKLDKPFYVSEFSFVCDYRGMHFYNQLTTMKDERSRGLAYRHYTEMMASSPLCFGLGFFIFYDQPVTRRSLSGEGHNFGLVNQQDQPYRELLQEVMKSNARLEEVHAGQLQPFVLENVIDCFSRRFRSRLGNIIPNTESACLSLDTSRGKDFYGGCMERVKINEQLLEMAGANGKMHSLGTHEIAKNKVKYLEADVYLWYKLRRKDFNDYYAIEVSQDGKNFTPVRTVFDLEDQLEFDHYVFSNADPFPAGTKYARIVLKCPVASQSWANQIANIREK